MAYFLDFSNAALDDAQDALAWMEEHAPAYATEWYTGLMAASFSLEEMPKRWPLAPENDIYTQQVRHLLYKKRSTTYRILFVVVREETDEQEGVVRILRIRHGAQNPLTLPELKRAEKD